MTSNCLTNTIAWVVGYRTDIVPLAGLGAYEIPCGRATAETVQLIPPAAWEPVAIVAVPLR